MTSLSEEIHYTPDSISFSVFSPSEIRALSKLEITNTISMNDLGQPIPKGLYDLRMGPYMSNYGICATCHLNYVHCPGHLGHIELAMPVINPLFRSVAMSMLSRCCLYCSALLYPAPMLVLTSVQLELLRRGLTAEVASANDLFSTAGGGATTRGSKGAAAAEIDALDDAPTKETSSESVRRLRGFLEGVIATHGVSAEVATDVRNVVLERRSVLKRFLGYKPLKDCPECHKHQPSLNDFLGQIVKIEKNVTRTRRKKGEKMLDGGEVRSYLTSLEARDVMRKLWQREQKLLCEVFGVLQTARQSNHDNPTDCFFIEALPVTSPRLRPMDSVNGRLSEHSHTFLYNSVLVCSQLLKRLLVVRKTGQPVDDLPADDARAIRSVKGNSLDEKIMRTWGNLQGLVDCVVDVDMNKYTAKRLKVKDLRGIRQVLEKKEGILRMNMMGKRVDYAGRTVITPDPYLSVEEMGVPEVMAKRLTYPEPVTVLNLSSLQQAVLNGPNVHPGANAIEFGNGVKVVLKDDKKQLTSSAAGLLTPVDQQSRKMMAPKVVHRHLNSGDVVLLNRQPTLHRPSIMAHRVRVLPSEKTFRLHYSNCKCYNADFDGDEMNIHLPQGEEARSEAFNLAFSPYHFLVPKDGTPLGGLIQDHVIAGVVLSMRDRCFRRAEYLQMVASGLATLRHRIKTLPPAILKPGPFWTGKQVISTIIINVTPSGRPAINLQSVANLNSRIWQRAPPRPWTVGGPIVEPDLSESEVIIRDGHLLCGVLDKKQFGAVPFSLVHGFYELYGGLSSSALLSAFSRLFTHCLQIFGFTLGVRDILVLAEADRQRQRTTMSLVEIGCNATCEALDIKSEEECADLTLVRRRLEVCHLAKDPRATRDMDRAYKQRLDVVNNDINKACLPRGLIEKFPENNLQLMVESGAKGSKVNTMQISCLLGQIELEGKRPPRMLSGKTLPSFVAYDLTPRAGGFISGRFMTGIRPQEYFFHCMAGREGLIDTAVKTSRSGYLQRCLIKHLEGLIVGYDLSVRDSDGSVIQFRYGEDGHETQKVQYLTEKQMSFFERNHLGVVDIETLANFKGRSDTHKVNKTKKRIRRWRREFGSPPRQQRSSPFLEFCRRLDSEQANTEFGGEHKRKKLGDLWRRVADRSPYEKLCRPCPDPVNSTHHPDAHFSSVSEHLENLIASYVRHRTGSEQLSDLLYYKCARSCVQPGEAVGLVAAQSIGEPSTQMTLNTFHFAGRGDMNVTLGIPRLKEVLGASKSMKTPSMEIPFRRDVPDLRSQAQRLKLQLTRVTLAQVLRDVTVTERLHLGRSRVYKLHLRFLPRSAYKHELPVTPAAVVRFVENTWIRQLIRKLSKALKFRDVDGVLGNKESDAEAAAASAGDVLEDEDAAVDNPGDEPAAAEGDSGGNAGASSDEEANDEEDAKGARSRSRQKDEGEYESEEEGDDDARDTEALMVDGEDGDDSLPAFTTSSSSISMSQRQITVLTQRTDNCTVDTYLYDQKNERWCEFTITTATNRQCDIQSLVRDAAVVGVIREVPQIRRAFVVDDQSGGLQLCTEGINMLYMVRFSNLLDLSRMYCNDLHSMAATYGVEAASKAIVREIGTVFGVYGIKVNARHLSLVADYMTFSGSVAGFNRSAMEAVVSPLQQMTFETTVRFLRSAVLSGQGDDLKSPSARLIFGQPFTGGTGMFSLINKLV